MGRKKKKTVKPWCWYCNRDFEDDKILIQHQKAKHFKCHICHKKLFTGPGLAIHCMQVHKETIDKIPHSLPNRGSTDIEVYGMEGIPEEDLIAHEQEKLGEPDSKMPKVDIPIPPPMPPAGFAPMPMPGMPMHPGMMPPMPGGMPPYMPRPGFPPMPFPMGMPRPPLPRPPSMPPPKDTNSPEGSPHVTFPAYSGQDQSNGAAPQKEERPPPALLPPTGTGTKIMHPDQDISLEELRAAKPKYQPGGSSRPARAGQGREYGGMPSMGYPPAHSGYRAY